jgi:hypothetical protein
MNDIIIKTERQDDLLSFLQNHDFIVENLENNIHRVLREEEDPVYLSISETNLYFEVDLGNISGIASQDLYFSLLNFNTEILPVSFAINNSNPKDPRLVLVESRETVDLCDAEILSVFDALALASEKAETLLTKFIGA